MRVSDGLCQQHLSEWFRPGICPCPEPRLTLWGSWRRRRLRGKRLPYPRRNSGQRSPVAILVTVDRTKQTLGPQVAFTLLFVWLSASTVHCNGGAADADEPPPAPLASVVDPPARGDVWGAVRAWDPETRVVVPEYPYMEDEDDTVSASVGTVTEGHLFNAAELVLPGSNYGILPRQLERNLRFGTTEMVALLTDAADEMAVQYPGTVLWLGNLGGRHGGDIPYSVSHNAGRDADIAFFYVDGEGNPVVPPDLLALGRDLRTEGPGPTLHFDVERNWALIEALLAHEGTQIQFLFISNPLKRELLRHARSQGVSRRTLERADTVMSQPGRRNPHNDHLHLRIYCGAGDVERGCVNTGRIHPWVDTYESNRRARLDSLRDYLSHSDAEQRARAIERLVILGSRGDLSRIANLLDDDHPLVRSAAAEAVGHFDGRRWQEELVALWSTDDEVPVLLSVADALGALGGAEVGELLTERLREPRPVPWQGRTIDARMLLADALAVAGYEAAAEPLADLLVSQDPLLRNRVVWSLGRLTNASFGSHWSDLQLDAVALASSAESWKDWIAELVAAGEVDWIELGFARAGLDTVKEGEADLAMLAHAVAKGPAHISYNAQLLLMELMDREVPSLSWPHADAAWYWRAAVR